MALSRNFRSSLFSPFNTLDGFDDIFSSPLFLTNSNLDLSSIKVDMKEHDKHYLIKADMPGMNKENIKVALNNGLLNISGHRSSNRDQTDENSHTHISERSYGSFSRSLRVSDNVDKNNIKAEYIDGVLNITLPKTSEESGSKIINVL